MQLLIHVHVLLGYCMKCLIPIKSKPKIGKNSNQLQLKMSLRNFNYRKIESAKKGNWFYIDIFFINCTAADSCTCIVCCTHYLIPIKECMNCKSVTMKTWFERLKRKKVKTKDLTSQSIRRISLLGSYLRSQNEINETRVEIITINN